MQPVILVVDDSEYVRELYTSILSEIGIVIAFAGVREALPLLRQADLVLTDLMMPGLTGMDLLDYMRDEEFETPIVVLTAVESDDPTVLEIRRRGIPVLFKPFRVQDLQGTVWRMLQAVGMRTGRSAHRVAAT